MGDLILIWVKSEHILTHEPDAEAILHKAKVAGDLIRISSRLPGLIKFRGKTKFNLSKGRVGDLIRANAG